MRWFVRGDIDGFFGLALDNLIQILVIIGLCGGLLGFPDDLLYGRILPGVAISLIVGNLFYSWLAIRVGRKEGRKDLCALPYGINTPSVFVYIFLVMLPVKLMAEAGGAQPDEAARLAWIAGLIACLGSGILEAMGAIFAEWIRKATPRPALLSTLSGIALGFISMPFLYRSFAFPVVGFTTLIIICIVYFGKVKFKGNIPGGLVTVVLGTLLCFATGVPRPDAPQQLNIVFPMPVIGEIFSGLQSGYLIQFISVIIPMGAFNIIGSMQNIESAEAAGDKYPTAPALAMNGLGSIAAALFGSCFPTTIYIGHPGWKELGSGAGYSVMNAVFMTALCVTGAIGFLAHYVPVEAGMAIVLWIGIVITAQAFQATEKEEMPAAVIGVLIGVAAWGSVMAKAGMRAVDHVFDGKLLWVNEKDKIIKAFKDGDVFIEGAFALEQGVIFTAMIFAAMIVYIIRNQFYRAAIWAMIGALVSLAGLAHRFTWDVKDAPLLLKPAWQWSLAYGIMAVLLCLIPFVGVARKSANQPQN